MTSFLYNPDLKNRRQLIFEFVDRDRLLRKIMHDLKTSGLHGADQHYLLSGPRGGGKTTLLNRIKYAVSSSEKLQDHLVPVLLREEQYNISTLADVWENIARVLEDDHSIPVIDKMRPYVAQPGYENIAFETLETTLRERNKKILLLVDNFGDFLRKLDEMEVRRLREVLQKTCIRLIGGTTDNLSTFKDYQKPFHHFFEIYNLSGLTNAETIELLRKLAKVHGEEEKTEAIIAQQPARIETLRYLTDGLPRAMVIMFGVFVDYKYENCLRDLQRILDVITPMYKSLMDLLPAEQQKIVDAMAKYWDNIELTVLSDELRMDSETVAAHLEKMEAQQVVTREVSHENERTVVLYRLRERIFNIWYLMRYGSKSERQRMTGTVRIFEHMYAQIAVKETVTSIVENVPETYESAAVQSIYLSAIGIGLSGKPDYSIKILVDMAINCAAMVPDERSLYYVKGHAHFNVLIDLFKLMYHHCPHLLEEKNIIDRNGFRYYYEPVYHSLLIITGRMDKSRIPPEKVELIRNIVERITSND